MHPILITSEKNEWVITYTLPKEIPLIMAVVPVLPVLFINEVAPFFLNSIEVVYLELLLVFSIYNMILHYFALIKLAIAQHISINSRFYAYCSHGLADFNPFNSPLCID